MRLLLLLLTLTASTARATFVPGDGERTVVFAGVERRYLVHVPASYDGSHAVPLVLDFHGLGSNAEQQKQVSGWIPVSDREGFLLVHPDGLNHAWNAGTCCFNAGIDDVGFIRTVVAQVAAEGNVDPRRVYATGLSNGGAISQRLACDAADLFAAAAPMAFPVPANPLSSCQPARAIPVLTFMGLVDVLVDYDGGFFASAPDTFAFWHDVDGCRGTTPDDTVTSGASRCETYSHCTNGVEAGLCSITAATSPGSPVSGHILYFQKDFDLAEVAWAFLSRFELPKKLREVAGEVRGDDHLALGDHTPDAATAVWQVTLGDGTWSASDGKGLFLGGSARGRGGRRTLFLSADAARVLAARLGARATALGGTRADVTPGASTRLVARVRGKHVRIAGKLPLAGGSFTVRLAGTVAKAR